MKKLFAITSLALLTSTAFAAEAGKTDTGLDYNEISISYLSSDITNTSTDVKSTLTGYGLSATYLLTENIFINGQYSSMEKSPTTIATTSGSLGYRLPMSDSVDALATVGYGYTTITGTTHKDSYPMSLGVRAVVTPELDLGASLIYVEADDAQSGFGASAKYKINSNIFIRGDYKSLTDSTSYSIGIGFKF